jgi:hypothetical protein
MLKKEDIAQLFERFEKRVAHFADVGSTVQTNTGMNIMKQYIKTISGKSNLAERGLYYG